MSIRSSFRIARGSVPLVLLSAATLLTGVRATRAAAPLGDEFQINETTVGAQRFAAISSDADGDFVVVWHSLGQDGDDAGIFGRRFSSSGEALGGEFQVNTYTPGKQAYPRVASAPGGGFVVVWEGPRQDSGPTREVYAARFDSTGTPQAGEFQVNAFEVNEQRYPAVAVHSDGGFVIAWHSNVQDGNQNGVFAAGFDSAGGAVGAELQVNAYTTNNQSLPDVAADGSGGFVAVWQSNGQDGDNQGVFARRFDSAGSALSQELQVNVYTAGAQGPPRVAAGPEGDFVVAWHSPQDGGGNGIFVRRFDDGGVPLVSELQVNTYTFGVQNRPVVGVDAAGGFAVAWQDFSKDGSLSGVFARRYDSGGQPQTRDFQVYTHTDLYQQTPALAMEGDGDFVVVWQSSPQDGDSDGIFGQRYRRFTDFDIDGNGGALPLTDGLLILRYLFGFRGATLVTGAVGPDCTRCDAPAIEAFLAAQL